MTAEKRTQDPGLEPRTRRRATGFTLVELMITVVIMGLLVIYLMNAMQKSQQKTVVVEQITEAQQSLRVIGELLEQDLRHAGMLVPESGAACGVDSTSGPDVLVVSDASAIAPDGSLSESVGALITGAPTNVSTGGNSVTVDSLILEKVTPDAAYDNDADGTNDTDFQIGGGIIVTDRVNPSRGSACGTVTQIAGTTAIRFSILSPPLGAVPGSGGTPELILIPARIYQVNGNRLTRNGMLVSSDVEDLQVAYFIDADDNNVIGAEEYKADGVGAQDAFSPDSLDMSLVREIRANVVVRTRSQEKDNQQGVFQPTENRAAVAGQDGFRRRVYTTVVRLRNVGARNPTI